MPEWWSYRLSDFLLFSPRTYYRMIERLNESVWPAHLLTLALGGMILVLALRPTVPRLRIAWMTLALLWLWTGWAFVGRRYSAINWAAVYLLPLFGLQALLLVVAALRASTASQFRGWTRATGLTLLAGAVVFYPVIAPLLGRGWGQAEVFGIAPDPTALATLGLVLLAPSRQAAGLMAIPVLWCLISGLTLWAMDSPEAWLPPALALSSVLVTTLLRTRTTAAPESGAAV
jgi:hypothetical protein